MAAMPRSPTWMRLTPSGTYRVAASCPDVCGSGGRSAHSGQTARSSIGCRAKPPRSGMAAC
eukprot:776708-Prymnesium_polylepis.1